MWKLISAMEDRIAYDKMAREAGQDSAKVLDDEDLQKVDPHQVAIEVFEADLTAGLIDVDDIEEARARWKENFPTGYEDERNRRKN